MSSNENDSGRRAGIEAAAFELSAAAGGAAPANSRLRLFILLAVSVVLAALVVLVILALPRWVEQKPQLATSTAQPATTTDTVAPAAEAQPEAVLAAADPAASREDTQAQLRATLDKVELLEKLHAEQWAKTELHTIRQRIAEGEKAYREKRYVTAQNIYLDTRAQVERLLKQVPDIVTGLLDAGKLALARGDSAAARAAFEQILTMQPEHKDAAAGLARARTLDQVLALIAEGEGYERLDQTSAALNSYRAALALDSAAGGAAAAVLRLEQGQREARFRAAMSAGHSALATQQFSVARTAFAKAAALDGTRREVLDAVQQLDHAETSFHIDRHLKVAQQSAAAERWDDAHSAFSAALKLDPQLTQARSGQQTAARRRQLDAQLQAHLADTSRLSSAAVHVEASAVLDAARQIGSTDARLSRQIAELERAVKLAHTPIAVQLQSDNATQVTLYRVGEFGQFAQRGLELLPGRYTAVGKRDGYRDVRVEFTLSHGHTTAPVVVRCEEKLAFGK